MRRKTFLICLFCFAVAGCSDDSSEGNGSTVCGNGIVEGTEACDDGDTIADNGCNADCTAFTDGWECPPTGGACTRKAVCGNGIVEGNEACDDGDKLDGNGCNADCTRVEDDWNCPPTGGACTRKAVCGNGIVEGDEACDDGDKQDGNGCNADCTRVENDWNCPPKGGACTRVVRCGNGIVEDGEACDDGDKQDDNGCKADCSAVNEHWRCPPEGGECTYLPWCGDGQVNDPKEECDGGSITGEYGRKLCTASCEKAHFCGDGKLDPVDIRHKEECDTGGKDTSAEYNGCNLECKRVLFCGDGKIQSEHERCDDGDSNDGDGCSSSCVVEPDWGCTTVEGKSECKRTIFCGDGHIDSRWGETCDDGARKDGDGCSAFCTLEPGFRCHQNDDGVTECTKTCGDGHVDADASEQCDDGGLTSGDGCSDSCQIEMGYACDETGCFAKSCGDGIRIGSEECDDGNRNNHDGCSIFCQREEGWHCEKNEAGRDICLRDACGDGMKTGDEECDEGPNNHTAGCVECRIAQHWKCPEPGQPCVQIECGDGILEGSETCEESNECCSDCAIQPFCKCDDNGKNCVKGECGNGILEYGEECDDHNKTAGDGCSPVCKSEAIYTCHDGLCQAKCGDGLVIPGKEDCDDGNLDNGDGCSSHCKIESGFTCKNPDPVGEPDVLNVPITYRDFRMYHYGDTKNLDYGDYKTPTQGPGFFSQELFDSLPNHCKKPSTVPEGTYTPANTYRHRHWPIVGSPIPDFNGNGCWGDHKCENVIYPYLDDDGKPILRPAPEMTDKYTISNDEFDDHCYQLYTCTELFDYWYRDTSMSLRFDEKLPLKKKTTSDGKTVYQAKYVETSADPEGLGQFWPLARKGFHATDADKRYVVREKAEGSFTSEFQAYFKYEGGETLTFNGDDDVWVFFNGHLVLELAGIHSTWTKSVTLTEAEAAKYDMYKGGIYPIKVFHAERCQGSSRFTLTLAGFVNMGQSECTAICGDGIKQPTEECDFEGDHTDVSLQHAAGCSETCELQPWCGNGKIEVGEGCERTNENKDWCTEECKIATCGNGALDEHEQCDPSVTGTTNCQDTCKFAGCGDGYLDPDEECDDGNVEDDDMCTHDCKLPRCGDGIVSAGEVCDDGENAGAYGGCGFGCSYFAPRCGDKIIDRASGEECDDGDGQNVGGYGRCNAECKRDTYCGDGIPQYEYEECDGEDKCSDACRWLVN